LTLVNPYVVSPEASHARDATAIAAD